MGNSRLQRMQDQVIAGLTLFLLTASAGFLWNISESIKTVSKELALVTQSVSVNSQEIRLHSQTLVNYGNRLTKLETELQGINPKKEK